MVAERKAGRYDGGMQKFWSISAIAVYFYVATVLTDYGFLSYFNIPTNFIQASISQNIVFSYQYLTAYLILLREMHWYAWLGLIIFVGIVLVLYYSIFQYKNHWKKALVAAFTVLWLLFLGTFFHLGAVIAANQTSFIMPTNCSIGQDYAYIVPSIDGNTTVLVPIDKNRKMTGGFLVRNTADLACTFAWKDIGGKVTQ